MFDGDVVALLDIWEAAPQQVVFHLVARGDAHLAPDGATGSHRVPQISALSYALGLSSETRVAVSNSMGPACQAFCEAVWVNVWHLLVVMSAQMAHRQGLHDMDMPADRGGSAAVVAARPPLPSQPDTSPTCSRA
jgi:hypothetical protein